MITNLQESYKSSSITLIVNYFSFLAIRFVVSFTTPSTKPKGSFLQCGGPAEGPRRQDGGPWLQCPGGPEQQLGGRPHLSEGGGPGERVGVLESSS